MALEQVGVKAVIEGLTSFNRGMREMRRGIIDVGDAGMTAAKRTETLNKALKITGTALVAASGAAGALLYSSVKLAARVETLGVVTTTLGRNVGKTEDQIRDLEQAIVDQGITLQGARTAIALMIQSQIDLKHSVELAAEAQNAAVIAGVNSTEAFERLVYTITSGNVRMARTLGLQVSFQGAYERTAESLGKTTDELTELDKVEARTNEVLRAGTTIVGAYDAAMETAGKQVTSLDRYIEESKRTLGEAWLPVYAKVVKFITDSLKTWLALTKAKKTVISQTLGTVAAFGALFGVIALIMSKVSAAIAGFKLLATAVAGSGTIVFSATAVLGIYIAAIAAVGIAIVKVIETINRYKAGLQAVRDAYKEHEKHMLKVSGSYEEYRKEMIRSGLIVAQAELGQRKYNRILREGGEEVVLAAAGIDIINEELYTERQRTYAVSKVTDELSYELGNMGRQMVRASESTDKLARSQEELQADLDRLKKTIDLDITEQFDDYKEKVDDLNKKIGELEAIKDPTKDQREDLAKTRSELLEVQKQWDLTTARIIFDLAEQRLAIGGFTEEELSALRKLAGPEGLGLIDEAAVNLLDNIDHLARELDAAGDQSDIFAGKATALQTPLQNAAASAGSLATAIGRIKSKTVTVTYKQRTYVETIRYVSRAPSALPSQVRQHGGFLQAGQSALMHPPEIFIPQQSGMVLSNRFVNAINTLVSAIKAAPMLAAPPALATSTVNTNYSNQNILNINTRAPIEPIIGDFRAMQAMSPF